MTNQMNDTVCNGGECDRRRTCVYTRTPHWNGQRIYAVKPGGHCGYYKELPPQRVVISGSNNTVVQVTPESTVIFKN